MTSHYDLVQNRLQENPRCWAITGVAGFIGSNLLEALLRLNQTVVGLDNFSTIDDRNLEQVRKLVGESRWKNFTFFKGDIRHLDDCQRVCDGADIVLHQAALGSVPRSIEDPLTTHASNIDGFLNMLRTAQLAGIERFIYAASSSTYGDHPGLPKKEEIIGNPLSPYAVTKLVNELYAQVFDRVYRFKATGLRYFNVFGPRQNPEGAYAAVIPRWFGGLLKGKPIDINGDGETSRDFCYVDNVVQANILAACTERPEALGQVYNIAYAESTTLNQLYALICAQLKQRTPDWAIPSPRYRDFRAGDVRHSLADIHKARQLLGYEPRFSVREGLEKAADWYTHNL